MKTKRRGLRGMTRAVQRTVCLLYRFLTVSLVGVNEQEKNLDRLYTQALATQVFALLNFIVKDYYLFCDYICEVNIVIIIIHDRRLNRYFFFFFFNFFFLVFYFFLVLKSLILTCEQIFFHVGRTQRSKVIPSSQKAVIISNSSSSSCSPCNLVPQAK